MKKFDKRFSVDTLAMREDENVFRKITSIHETRNWVTLEGLGGSFQRGHISKFTNKEKKTITIEKIKEDIITVKKMQVMQNNILEILMAEFDRKKEEHGS